MQIHVGSDMRVCNYHFKRAVVVAVASFKRPFDDGCKISCLGCLAALLMLLWRTVHLFMSVPRAPAARLPKAPSKNMNKGHILSQESGGERKSVCACVSGSTLNLKCRETLCMHPVKRPLCISVFLSISICVCVCAYVASPESRGIPTRYYATVLCNTLFCTKGLFVSCWAL